MEVLRFELNQLNATDLQSAPTLRRWRTSIIKVIALAIETRMGFEHINLSVADWCLTFQPSCLLRKRWELNPHESLAPNGFQDRGHHPLACSSFVVDAVGVEPTSPRLKAECSI